MRLGKVGAGLARASSELGREVGAIAGEARRAWTWRSTAWLGGFLALAALGPTFLGVGGLESAASFLYLALAAVGLNFAAGLAGVPSLAQGAFVGIGAFGAALLIARAGWPAGAATIAGAGLAAAGGLVTGLAAVRQSSAFAAVSTWLAAWLVALGLAAFPDVFGGAQGIPATPTPGPDGSLPGGQLTPAGNFEMGLMLLAVALLAFARTRRGPAGVALALAEEAPETATAVGIEPAPRRLGLFVASAGIGGLAGALAVQASGVADAGAYGPQLSVELFVAVLIGGRGTVLGPVAGAALLALIDPSARVLAGLLDTGAERLEGVVAAALLAVALVAGGPGLAGLVRRLRPDAGRAVEAPDGHSRSRSRSRHREAGEPVLRAEGVTVRFGGVVALEGVDAEVAAGQIQAVIGPNGSGKSTLLRVLGGTLRPTEGSIRLLGRDVTDEGARSRVRGGLSGTLQRTSVAPRLRTAEHALAGADARRTTGALRHLMGTPDAREEDRALRDEAAGVLVLAGLAGVAERPVGRLNGAEARLASIATALAARPRVVLLDEPAAGMSAAARGRLRDLLLELREAGLAVLLVEHDLHLVRAVADVVTVLDAGSVIARGTPSAVARDPEVARAYLGPPSARAPRRRPGPKGDL